MKIRLGIFRLKTFRDGDYWYIRFSIGKRFWKIGTEGYSRGIIHI